jgi:hypothetical protein
LTLGLWVPAGVGMYLLAEKVNRNGGVVNMALGFVGGYFASWALTNLMGISVSMIAPFMGVTALFIVVGLIANVAAPVFICCCGSAGVGMFAFLKSK